MSANTEKLKKSFFLPVLIIAALAIGLYLNTLKNGFVYDDNDTILKNNILIKSFDNLPLMLDKTAYFNRSGEMSYRPVVTITYFIDYAFYGLKSSGYHLTNILLHAINGVLLYFFLTLLFTSHSSRITPHAFFTSILFVAHPVLTEAVNGISFREDLLVFLFYVATLSLYLILRQRPLTTAFLYPLSCFTFLLALLSKEMAATLPLIILCYESLYGRENTKLHSRLFNRYNMGYIAITFFYLYIRFYLFHNHKEQILPWGLIERFLTLPWLIVSYLKLGLFPVHLSADYVIYPVSSPSSPIFILPLIALVSIFAIIVILGNKKRNASGFLQAKTIAVPEAPLSGIESFGDDRQFRSRHRSILFGALFFLITLAPVYNLVPLASQFAERYLYLPMAGFVLFVAFFASLIAEKLKIRPGYGNLYMPIFFIAVLIIFSFSVIKRNTDWKDSYSLWSDTVVKMPNSSLAHNNLGLAYYDQRRFDEAIGEYISAIKLRYDHENAHFNLGKVYFKIGRYDEAAYELETALKLKARYLQ